MQYPANTVAGMNRPATPAFLNWALTAWCLLLFAAGTTMAQEDPGDDVEDPGMRLTTEGEGPEAQLERLFYLTSPPVGAPLPDVNCFDSDGQPVALRSVVGKYTVLLFGCLT